MYVWNKKRKYTREEQQKEIIITRRTLLYLFTAISFHFSAFLLLANLSSCLFFWTIMFINVVFFTVADKNKIIRKIKIIAVHFRCFVVGFRQNKRYSPVWSFADHKHIKY